MSQAVTIVVVSGDDASQVELETALRPHFPEIPVVDLGGRTVREAGEMPEIAESDFLWFLTPDSRPEPDCLDELLDAIGRRNPSQQSDRSSCAPAASSPRE